MTFAVDYSRFMTVHYCGGNAVKNTFTSYQAALEFFSALRGLQGIENVELFGIREEKTPLLRMDTYVERDERRDETAKAVPVLRE